MFGMKAPPLIRTLDEVKMKVQLLDALTDIKIAMAKISAGEAEASTQALVDINYRSLGIELVPLAKSSADFKMVDKYLHNTHGHTHSDFQLELLVRRRDRGPFHTPLTQAIRRVYRTSLPSPRTCRSATARTRCWCG